jgi:hypothetical protein
VIKRCEVIWCRWNRKCWCWCNWCWWVRSVDGSAGNGADGTDAGGFVDDNVGDSAGRFLGDGANAGGSAGDRIGRFTNNLAGADAVDHACGMGFVTNGNLLLWIILVMVLVYVDRAS